MIGFQFCAEIRRFLADQNGGTAIEYALIASGVSVAIVTAVAGLGTNLKTVYYDKLGSLFP